jgi:hypothetical protein
MELRILVSAVRSRPCPLDGPCPGRGFFVGWLFRLLNHIASNRQFVAGRSFGRVLIRSREVRHVVRLGATGFAHRYLHKSASLGWVVIGEGDVGEAG